MKAEAGTSKIKYLYSKPHFMKFIFHIMARILFSFFRHSSEGAQSKRRTINYLMINEVLRFNESKHSVSKKKGGKDWDHLQNHIHIETDIQMFHIHFQ